MDIDAAYDRCLQDVRAHYENFPVASRLVPSRMRPHVAAVYAFARAADDFADEGLRTADERLALLESWRRRLAAATQSSAALGPLAVGEPPHADAIFLALGTSIRRLDLPVSCLEDLLSAFEQDVRVATYESWADVLDYCRRSANPVGRLVLRIAGISEERFDAWSDSICTALQLTNFWQDFAVDLDRGRIYLPRAIQRAYDARIEDLGGGMTPEWRGAISHAVAQTRDLFELGRPLCSALTGRLRFEIRATYLGGLRVLDRIERADFDVVGQRPKLGFSDVAWIAVRLLR